ncbi:MAG: DUF4147 domain-containing protein [Acidobacteria bacterium]|nr:DUF4147 domain-containing protein [Acidobacteriota bacterium]
MDLRSVLEHIQRSALEAVDPERAVLRFLSQKDGQLQVADKTYSLSRRRVFLIGAGKAGLPMARAVERVLGDELEAGIEAGAVLAGDTGDQCAFAHRLG